MFTRGSVAFLSALALTLLCGCGDSDGNSRPRYRAEVDPQLGDQTPVSMLSSAERERVCRSYDAYVETHVSFEAIAYIACLPPAIVFGGDRDGCEQQLEDCMALFPEPITIEVQVEDTQVCIDRLGDCNASVLQFEGCANVNLDLVLDIFDNWSCRGIDQDRIAEAARVMDTVSVCADVDDACGDVVAIGPD